PIEMTLASAWTDTIRRVSAREIQKIIRRVRRLQRQVKVLRQDGRAQRRIVAGVERRFTRLKARALRTGMSAGPGRPLTPQSIRSLRERLRMPRIAFAKLVGVSPGSIFGWETGRRWIRSEEHTSELQSRVDLVCRLLLEKKKKQTQNAAIAGTCE